MKTIHALVVFALLSVAAHAAPSSFEGKIGLQISEGKKTSLLSYFFKGGLMRIEMTEAGENFAMILDLEKRESTMIMPSEQMYMVMKLGDETEVADEGTAPEKTGRSETILGYVCEEYTVTEKKSVTEYWAAKGLGVFRGMRKDGPGASAAPSAWEIMAEKDGLFPLRIVEKNPKGKELSRIQATSIEPGKLKDDLFAPPKGFQKFEMPNFGNMFKG